MTADEIVAIANELDCRPSSSAVTFATMLAEHCALIAEDAEVEGASAAAAIRQAFKLDELWQAPQQAEADRPQSTPNL